MPPRAPQSVRRAVQLHPRLHFIQLPVRSASSSSTTTSGSPAAKPTTAPSPASTSSSSSTANIPPESPRFVHVPQPPQQQAVRPRPQKGVLPCPRRIFGGQNKHRLDPATDDAFLALTTPPPAADASARKQPRTAEERARIELRGRQAALRRENLRAGLAELRVRKERVDARAAGRSSAKMAEYRRAVARPEREDERLTAVSLSPDVRALLEAKKQKEKPTLTAEEQAREAEAQAAELARRRERFAARQARRAQEQRAELHALYTTAGGFVTDEAGLDALLQREFDKPFYRKNPHASIWDEEGMPETVTWLQRRGGTGADAGTVVGAAGQGSVEWNQAAGEVARERAGRVAGELTGGKI